MKAPDPSFLTSVPAGGLSVAMPGPMKPPQHRNVIILRDFRPASVMPAATYSKRLETAQEGIGRLASAKSRC